MDSTIKISIIVPVYNVEKYIVECLESICQQWETGIEVILVDDGSTDESGNICEYYAQKYSYISVIHQSNKGLGGARNSGTKIARGEYIAWIDSDDVLANNWAFELMKIIEKYNPDLIFYDFISFDAINEKNTFYGQKSEYITKEQFIEDVMRDIKLQSYAWQKVIKREFCLKELFLEDREPLEDYEIMYRLLINIKTVYYINKCLYKYRQREDSLIRGHDFNQSLHSYELSINRCNAVSIMYSSAAITARCIQGYRLCKFDDIRLKNDSIIHLKCKEVRRYIRSNLLLVGVSRKVTFKWKVKFFIVAANIDLFFKMVSKRRKK